MDEKVKWGGKKVKKHDTSGSAGGDFFGGGGQVAEKYPFRLKIGVYGMFFLEKGCFCVLEACACIGGYFGFFHLNELKLK
jgi:hypothetical protein